jgi:predicted GNAT superfamily acetyltransferase
MYGMRTDALNAGVPTDRLIAEWPVEPGPPHALDVAGTLSLPRLVEGPDEPRVVEFSTVRDSPALLIEIPAQIATIRADDPPRAERWRSAFAASFSFTFGAGYQAVDVVRDSGRAFYVLRRTGEVSRSHVDS